VCYALLRAAGHDSTFEILVVEAPQVRIGFYAGRVILVPEPALTLLEARNCRRSSHMKPAMSTFGGTRLKPR
jgi:hypothetical protein